MAVTVELEASDLAAIATQVRTELSTELARIDTPVSSRLAAADYTAPDDAAALAAIAAVPTAEENAQAVWSYTE